MPVRPPIPSGLATPFGAATDVAPVVFTVDEIAAVSAALAGTARQGALTGPARTAVAKLFAAAMPRPEGSPAHIDGTAEPAEDPGFASEPAAQSVPPAQPAPLVRGSSPLSLVCTPAAAGAAAARPQRPEAPPGTQAAPPQRLARVIALPTRTAAVSRPLIDPGVRSLVDDAIAARRVLRLTYLDGKDKSSEREVEPAGILAASGHWYLIGWCRARQNGRAFRLDRITAAEPTAEPVRDRDMASVLGPLGRGGQTSGPVLRTR